MKHHFKVVKEQGVPLIGALMAELNDLEETLLRKIAYNGQVFINGKQQRDSTAQCLCDDIVTVIVPYVAHIEVPPEKGTVDVLYEDSLVRMGRARRPSELVGHYLLGTLEPTTYADSGQVHLLFLCVLILVCMLKV